MDDALSLTESLFFDRTGLDRGAVENLVADALVGSDDGELFLEETHSEMMLFDDGRMKSASYDNSSGFGLRAIAGEAHGYAHSGEMTIDAMRRAVRQFSSYQRLWRPAGAAATRRHQPRFVHIEKPA